jgi:hypothetical protein
MLEFPLPPGTLVAERFEIDRVAGRGGMGVVYRALDRETGAAVALKLLLDDGQDTGERFLREGRVLASLNHPNIVAHVAHGRSTAGTYYLAMEWLSGHDLEHHLTAGAMSLAACRTLIEGVAGGLAAAHARGIVHRDLKPTNLFLVDGDIARVRLLDFGIARPEDATQAITQTGAVVGTLGYMAPEQARSQRELTPAADLFSLGCVLYRCLTNEAPFTASHPVAALARILFDEPPPVHVRRPDVSVALARLLQRLLSKDPRDRWRDAGAFLADLVSLEAFADLGVATDAPTMTGTRAPAGPFAESERGLFSVVLARLPSGLGPGSGDDGTESSRPGLDEAARATLRRALIALGVAADFLLDSTLVVTVPALESARDQAIRGAHAALLVRERWPASVVSLATGRGTRHDRAPVGEVLDRAAAVLRDSSAGGAPPRPGVYVDALSAQLLDGRFTATLRPDGEPILVPEREMDASRPLLGRPTPCVGREAELAHLDGLFRMSVEEPCARVALVTAAPGMGKSRLRHEFQRRLAAHPEAPLVLCGAAELMNAGAPHAILGDAVRRHCGIGPGEEARAPGLAWARLRAAIAARLAPTEAERVAIFLGEMAGIHSSDPGNALLRPAREDPRILRDRIKEAFVDWLRAECRAGPVVFLLDDLHWADPLSVALLDQALRALADAPFLVVALARPEVKTPYPRLWQAHAPHEIALKGLSRRACGRLAELALGAGLSHEVSDRLIEHAAGNALFLEELIRAAAEGQSEGPSATVMAMLQARIGRLDAGPRRALLAASIFGQSFRVAGVAAVLSLPPDAAVLDAAVTALLDAEVIESREGGGLLHFRHALVRDAAYSLLAEADVGPGHLSAARFLEAGGEPDASVVAGHYETGGDLRRAATHHARAAEEALDTFFTERAVQSVARGLACDPETTTRATLQACECVAHFYSGRLERVYPLAQLALPHLRPGSRAWVRTLLGAFAGCPFGPPEWVAQFPRLIESMVSHDPEPDARVNYAEALSWMVVLMVQSVPPAVTRPVLDRLAWACDRARPQEPGVDRLRMIARTHAAWHYDPRPWSVLQSAEETIRLAEAAGDVRTIRLAMAYGETESLAELGAPEIALARWEARSELFRADEALGQGLYRTSVAHLRWSLGLPGAAEAALSVADALCEDTRAPPPMYARARDLRARLHLAKGHAEAAALDAREAHSALRRIPNCAPNTRATLMAALRARGEIDEAVAVAEESLALLSTFGGVGFAEVELRLAIAETLLAAGDAVRGRAALAETLRHVDLRAADIEDAAWRTRYLTRNPSCVRSRALAAELALAPGASGVGSEETPITGGDSG